MKKDWTYKKFEDCIENVKYTTKIQSKDYMASGGYPIISQEEELVSGYWNKNEDVFSAPRPLVVFGDHTRVLKYIDFDFVLGADGVKILLPIEDLEAKFLYYFLKWYNVPNLGYSRHYKLLKEISIPIPPLSIQRSIVAELDLLHSVISKKKEQLRELDDLAQSLFYQMFGDPITNPMGWEMRDFEDCIEKVKYTSKIQSRDYKARGTYPIISQEEELISGYWDNKEDVFVVSEPIVIFGDHTRVLKYIDFSFVLGADGVKILQPIHDINALFLFHFLKSYNIPNLGYSRHYKLLKEISLPIPSMSLQQSFSAKVSAIEAQKQAITQSIKETEALLAQRMDTYFS